MQRLVLAIHNHQPVGNFDHVFKEAYDRCYRPFVDLCGEFPQVKVALHYTGPLLEWLETNQIGLLRDLKALVARGQVEILGGGFYEPMLAVLPDADVHGQILKMRDFCRTHFGTEVTGMWLAERVWDPDLPRVISSTGMKYTLLDDSHFFAAGLAKGQLSGHYVTEKAAKPLSIFPIDQQLRYAIPWKPLAELEKHFQELQRTRGDDPRCLTYGDDGEKFGLWPGTWDWVYGKGHWLKDFFRMLADRKDLVTTQLPREALADTPPSGQVYLPTASYEEMGEWSLPTATTRPYDELRDRLKRENVYDRFQPFVRGGIWQGFFAKYPESNYLHKRVLQVSERLRGSEDWKPARRKLLDEAFTQLYRSECNCAYWHGVFGGLYLNNLRHALWEALLKAERDFDLVERGDRPFLTVTTADFDADLSPEVSVRSDQLSVVVSPKLGGSLLEIADLTRAFLLTDVLPRREEGYHDKLRAFDASGTGQGGVPGSTQDVVVSKEKDLSRFLIFDDYRRTAFRDRFFAPDFTLDALRSGSDGDLGTLDTLGYTLTPVKDGEAAALSVALSANGEIRSGDQRRPLRVEKTYAFARGRGGFDVGYQLTNAGTERLETIFAPELNLSLLTGDADDRLIELPNNRRERLKFRGEVKGLEGFSLFDGWSKLRLKLRAQRPFDLWSYPIEAISNSEGGFERNYQGSCFLLRTPIDLAPGASVALSFQLDLEHPS